jgi:hypothetical protein
MSKRIWMLGSLEFQPRDGRAASVEGPCSFERISLMMKASVIRGGGLCTYRFIRLIRLTTEEKHEKPQSG